MDDREKFEVLVNLMAKEIYGGNDDVDLFEDMIKQSQLGNAYFGVAGSDYDQIEVMSFSHPANKFHAEYYDGFQAPFLVCEWWGDYNALENLLLQSSKTLYEEYQQILSDYVG